MSSLTGAARAAIVVIVVIGLAVATPRAHAQNVQNVTVSGNLQVDFDARITHNTFIDGFVVVGSTPAGETAQPIPNGTKLAVIGNVAVTGGQSIFGNAEMRTTAHILGSLHIGKESGVIGGVGTGGEPIRLAVDGQVSIKGNEVLTGNQTLTGTQTFGVQTRQMINLFDTTYGIGVQNSALYLRTDSDVFWYRDGAHSNDFGNAGGGSQLMHLDGTGQLFTAGRIITPVLEITGGSDVAEPFAMSTRDIPPGSVVIIDDQQVGRLKVSAGAYDRRVAGVVSGANGIHPGISLSQQGALEGGQDVALSGRVYVLADASAHPIRPGDLLTSSDTPGHAMSVTDYARAQGAVIGKAMSPLPEGRGLVLVLIALQ